MSLRVVDHYITFNDKNFLTSFRVKIDGNKTFGSARRDVDHVIVPGRSGSLTIDNGRFGDVNVTYDCYIVDDFQKNAEALAAFLLQDAKRHRLEDTIHADSYRIGALDGAFDPEVIWLSAGRFELSFLCDPQRWLKSGEKPITVGSGQTITLWNPTRFTAKPLLHVTSGTGLIAMSGGSIQLTANNGNTYIDCETEDAWEGATNRNGNIVRVTGFPTLTPGANTITAASGMTLEITPRWWTV